MRLSPGCTDTLARGWVIEVGGQKCRVLGRSPVGWEVEVIPPDGRSQRERLTLPRGAAEMRKIEDSLRARGLL